MSKIGFGGLVSRVVGIFLPSDPAAAASGPQTYTVNWDNLTGVTNTSGTLRKTAANASFTNACAYASTQVPSGDFVFEFKTATGTFDGGMIGLKLVSDGVPTTGGGFAQYAFAFNLNDSDVFGVSSQVFEAGSSKGSVFGTAGNDTMIIRRVGSTVTYEQGVTVRYTNSSASTAAMYIGTNPYTNTGNDFLNNATITY